MESINITEAYSKDEIELMKELETTIQVGLSSSEVIKRQNHYGLNEINQKSGNNQFIIFLGQFNQPLIYILLAASFATAILKELTDSFVIFGVVCPVSIQ